MILALEMQRLNQWTAREILRESILKMMLQKKIVLNDMGKWQLYTVKIKSSYRAACTVCYFKKIYSNFNVFLSGIENILHTSY